MATKVKTKDFEISSDVIESLDEGSYELSAEALKKSTALSFETEFENIKYAELAANGDLEISISEKSNPIVIKGYFNTETKKVTSPIKYFKGTDTPENYAVNIIDEWGEVWADGLDLVTVKTNSKTGVKTFTGSQFADEIDLSVLGIGTDGADVVNAGVGNDIIYTSAGNDVITGGKGENTIVLTNKTDNPTIVLTKGEKLTIDASDFVGDLDDDDAITDEKAKFTYAFEKNNLFVKHEGTTVATIKGFASSDVTGADGSINLYLGDDESDNPVNIDLKNDVIFNYTDFTAKASSYTDKWFSSNIDASSLDSETVKKDKGATINAGAGNDEIKGSKWNDTINAGDGDDTITATAGVDKITAGKGTNTVIYGDIDWGSDTYTLTKGENLILNLEGTGLNKSDLNIEIVGNDIVVTAKKDAGENVKAGDEIVIKSYGKTNVLGEGNSVEIIAANGEIDLSDWEFSYEGFTNKKLSYTSNWHNEFIDASVLDTLDLKKGATVNAVDGENTIQGSKFADTIKGGKGDDDITGGAGNDNLYGVGGDNTFHFAAGDGEDKVYSQTGKNKGSDNLVFAEDIDEDNLEREGNNLVINHGEGDKVTVVGYFSGNSSVEQINGVDISNYIFDATKVEDGKLVKNTANSVKVSKTGAITLTGSVLSENLTGGNEADTIKATAGDNIIDGGKGDDSIYAGTGFDTIVFAQNSGTDTIYNSTSFTAIKTDIDDLNNLTFSKNGNNLEITAVGWNSDDKIVIANYFKSKDKVDTILAADGETVLVNIQDDIIEAGLLHIKGKGTIKGTENGDIIEGTQGYNDTITGGLGNDVILVGEGMGKDTIIYTKDENLNIVWKADDITTADAIEENFNIVKEGKDVIITSKKEGSTDKITIKNLANYDLSEAEVKFATTGCIAGVNLGTYDYPLGNSESEKALNITGTNLSETINGGKKNDVLKAVGGEDTITGNEGNDQLYGGTGVTTFEFGSKSGNDTVYLGTGKNILNFATGAVLSYASKGRDLVITNNLGEDDKNDVVVKNYFDGKGHDVEIKINGDAVEDITVTATDGADTLVSNGGTVEFVLGKGSDTVTGGSNAGDATTYTINKGDGNKVIIPGDAGELGTASNIINFGDDVTDAPSYTVKGDDLIITYTQADTSSKQKAETITVKGYAKNHENLNVKIGEDDLWTLADSNVTNKLGNLDAEGKQTVTGTLLSETLQGGKGNDTLTSNGGNDILIGGEGNDTFNGGNGSNQYRIGENDGQDTINLGKGLNNIVFADAITKHTYEASGNDLIIKSTDESNTSKVVVKNYLKDTTANVTVTFKDEAPINLLTAAQEAGLELGNKDEEKKAQTVNGTILNETLYGGKGNDTLKANVGEHTLNGGQGKDSLYSSKDGATTFVFNQGDGDDTIYNAKSLDDIQINGDYDDISYNRQGNDLLIKMDYTVEVDDEDTQKADTITVKNYFTAEDRIDNVTVNGDEIQLSEQKYAVTGKGTIKGTDLDDIVNGSESKDTISTGSGDDVINPGKGDDVINVDGAGVKTINLVDGNGSDTINITDEDATVKLIYSGADGVSYLASTDGKDLIINHNNDAKETTTIKGYFTSPKNVGIYADVDSDDNLFPPSFNNENLTIQLSKAGSITGTNNGETIIGSTGADKISTGSGADVIVATKGADTITVNGAGTKYILLSEGVGTDTVVITDKTAVVNFIDEVADITYSKSGNDLVINRTYETSKETTKVKDYFKEEGLHVKVNEDDELNFNGDDTLVLEGSGTITGSDYSETIIGSKSADTIKTGAGNDEIYVGAGKDTVIVNGVGEKNIYIQNADGDNTISLGYTASAIKELADDSITINLNMNEADDVSYEKSGDNLVIVAKYLPETEDDKEITQKTTIKDYFKTDIFDSSKVAINIGETPIAELIEEGLIVSGTKGTDYNDIITGTKSKDSFTTGSGDDVIFTKGGKGDVVTIDNTGAKSIVLDRADGTSDVTVKFGEELEGSLSTILNFTDETVIAETHPELSYEKVGNDLVVKAVYAKVDAVEETPARSAVEQKVIITDYFVAEKDYINTIKIGDSSLNIDNLIVQTVEGEGDKKGLYGTELNDEFIGTKNADKVLSTGSGNDVIDLGEGDDVITVDGAGNKTIIAGKGNDVVNGVETESSTTTIQYANDEVVYTKFGNDLVITDENGSTTVTGYFADATKEAIQTNAKVKFGGAEAVSIDSVLDGKLTVNGSATEAVTIYAADSDYGSIINASADNNAVSLGNSEKNDTVNVELDKLTTITETDSENAGDVVNVKLTDTDAYVFFDVDNDTSEESAFDGSLYIANKVSTNVTSQAVKINNYFDGRDGEGETIAKTADKLTFTVNGKETNVGAIITAVTSEVQAALAGMVDGEENPKYKSAFEAINSGNEADSKAILDIYKKYKIATTGDDSYNLKGGQTLTLTPGTGNDVIKTITGVNTLDFSDILPGNLSYEVVGDSKADLVITYGENSSIKIVGYKNAAPASTIIKLSGEDDTTLGDLVKAEDITAVYEYSDLAKESKSPSLEDNSNVGTMVLHFTTEGSISYKANSDNSLLVTNTYLPEGQTKAVSETITIKGFFKDGAGQLVHTDFAEKLHITFGADAVDDDNTVDALLSADGTFIEAVKPTEYSDIITANTAEFVEKSGSNIVTITKSSSEISSLADDGNDTYVVSADKVSIYDKAGSDTYSVSINKSTAINDKAGYDDRLIINDASKNELYYIFDVAKDVENDTDTDYAFDGSLYISKAQDIKGIAAGTSKNPVIKIDNYNTSWTAAVEEDVENEIDAKDSETISGGTIESISIIGSDKKNYDSAFNTDALDDIPNAVQMITGRVRHALTTLNEKLEEAESELTFNTAFDLINYDASKIEDEDEAKLVKDAQDAVISAYKSVRFGSDAIDNFTATQKDQAFYVGDGSDTVSFTAGSIDKAMVVGATNTYETTEEIDGEEVDVTNFNVDTIKVTGASSITDNVEEFWDSEDGQFTEANLTFTVNSTKTVDKEQVPVVETIKYYSVSDEIQNVALQNGDKTTYYTMIENASNDFEFEALANSKVFVESENTVNIASSDSGENTFEINAASGSTFEYNGASDKVTAYGDTDNSYDITVSNFTSGLVIDDKGGDADAINFENITTDSLRLFFNMTFEKDEEGNVTGIDDISEDEGFNFVTKDLLNAQSARNIIGETYQGVHVGASDTIESVSASTDEVDLSVYIAQVQDNVASWVENNADKLKGFDTVYDAINGLDKTSDVSKLVNAYNVSYTE